MKDEPNKDEENKMYEVHQQDPNITKLLTPGHTPLTCETAVALIKKKNHSLDEERTQTLNEASKQAGDKPEAKTLNLGEAINQAPIPARPPGRPRDSKDKLGIPFVGGTKEYMRSYYYCKREGKTYPELPEELKRKHGLTVPTTIAASGDAGGVCGIGGVPRRGEEKVVVASGTCSEYPPPVNLTPTTVDAVFKALTEFGHELKASQDFRKEQLMVLKQIDLNLSAMNNNTLLLRTAITELKGDLKRYSTVKH